MMDADKRSRNALKFMIKEFVGDDPERLATYQQEKIKARIARQAYDLRESAGLSQEELAALIGTTPETIDDIETADYDGDALSMLIRIAAGLRTSIDVHFVTTSASETTAATI
jgi:DNA-binding XRE family transcriptional regulator